MNKFELCCRCESVGRKPKRGVHKIVGPIGIRSLICNKCQKELIETDNLYYAADYEIEDYEKAS